MLHEVLQATLTVLYAVHHDGFKLDIEHSDSLM